MKVISIGRNPGCNIVLQNPMISRQHAIIKIHPFGKYEIVSMGSNGTKVNGNLIAPNQPYPIKRGDSITFAQAANLNWDMVPNPFKPIKIGGIIAAAVAVIALCCIFLIPLCCGGSSNEEVGGAAPEPEPKTAPADTVKEEKQSRDTVTPGKFTFPGESNGKDSAKKDDKKPSDKDKKKDKDSNNKKEKNDNNESEDGGIGRII